MWRKTVTHHSLLAIDFENNPIDGAFICAAIYGDITYRTKQKRGLERHVEAYFTSLSEVEDYLLTLKKGSCLLTMFNANYDKVFLANIRDDSTVLECKGRFITMKLKNGIKCLDLCNHVDGSLEDWISYLDMESKFGIRKEALDDLQKRVTSDARATYELGRFLEDFYVYECKTPIRLTCPSTTFQMFIRYYFTDYWFRNDEQTFVNKLERNAYYGGRVELYQRGRQRGFGYDINSMYLSVMSEAFIPDMATWQYVENGSIWQDYFSDYMGIYHVKVFAPKQKLMVLPWRTQDRKLIFPCGEFIGWWTDIELKLAIEQGYKVIECYDFIWYRKAKVYFKEFADFIWKERQRYKTEGNKGMELMIKKMGNSLYGKFAQRNNTNDYFGKIEDCPEEYLNLETHRVTFLPRIGSDSDKLEFVDSRAIVPTGTFPEFEFPAVSAFITAHARIKLYKAMRANLSSVIYCDTDSMKLKERAIGVIVGEGLGEWGYEGEFDYEFYRPKFYGDTVKGVPSRATLVERGLSSVVYEFQKPLREREARKRGDIPNRWVNVRKELSLIDDKRAWRDDSSFPIMLAIFNNVGLIDYASMDIAYGMDEGRYPMKLTYGERYNRVDDRTPEEQREIRLEKVEKRRRHEEIYQRGS